MLELAAVLPQLFRPLSMAEQFQHTPSLVAGVLDLCLASAFLAFSRAAPDFRVFSKTGAYYLLLAIEQIWVYHGGEGSDWLPRTIAIYLLVEMAAEAMEIQHSRWIVLLTPVIVVTLFLGWYPRFAYIRQWPLPASEVVLAILIFQGFLHGRQRDRLIAGALTVHWIVRLTAMSAVQQTFGIRPELRIGMWSWSYASMSQTLLGLLTLVVFVRALVADRAEKQRMSGELAAARAVQQVLIPECMPSTPGFEIESAYRPFGELGGDFFQVLPQADGSVLVAVGDVSGKGPPAAMLVSLVVGALHSLAETTSRPGELLAGLNRRVMGRSGGGFTTCLLFCAEQSGRTIFANAGHLSPYLEGRELVLDNGFPLGVVAHAVYEETEFALPAGATLTLVSDGVVEARDKRGELFGFERTEKISSASAEAIVEAALAFGQDDDMTALTIKRLA